jgi:hypothetical protein
VRRVYWSRTQRVYHFLSDNEYYAFLHHCYDDNVTDIREQFPLDRSETTLIAQQLGVRHPIDQSSRAPLVATTDLLVTRRTRDGLRDFAFAIKEDKDLTVLRTVEKLEIERVYWTIRGVAWDIEVSSKIKNNKAMNLAWMFGCDAAEDFSGISLAAIKIHLRSAFARSPAAPLRASCSSDGTSDTTSHGVYSRPTPIPRPARIRLLMSSSRCHFISLASIFARRAWTAAYSSA